MTRHGDELATAIQRLKGRLDWWQNDLAYKAPEQVGKAYAASLIQDLRWFVTPAMVIAEEVGGVPAPPGYDHEKRIAEYEGEHGEGSYERDFGDGMVAT